ncbi:MAG: hypothetical protein JWO36_3645 [Myxococcales bacterium]|nr:hypothetical protein [Myxococcales bacterium]
MPMRSSFVFGLAIASTVALGACGKDNAGTDVDASTTSDGSGGGGTPAFEIVSKDVTLMPGEQVTYCYYFHTSNTTDVLINKWVSDMSTGSHHAILYMTPGATQPADGTIDTSCGGLNGGRAPIWTYATQTPHQEENLPADDGTGKPLAQKIAPNSQGYIQLHYLNASDAAITAHIDLKAYALPTGTAYTQTDAYVTYNNDISIPPNATNLKVTASCPLPAGVKFWAMSTHSHKQSVTTDVMDGTSSIFHGTDWEHPGSKNWMTMPFYTFAQPKLTWDCVYDNTTPPPAGNNDKTVVAGQSAVTNEMCMATGYFFPSTGPKFQIVYNGSCIGL